MAGFKAYILDTYDELTNKVTWPSYSELQSSAIVVLVASVIIALLIWIMDYVFGVNAGDEVFWRGFLGVYYKIFAG
jgi:preprotein translocase subunit SecE